MNLSDALNLKDKVAIVTGGSRGIGRATVECFAALGGNVAVNFVKDERAAAEAVTAVQKLGGDALAVKADVSRVAEAQQLIDATVDHFGRLDFLVCNAGIWEGATVDEMSEETWDRTLDLNLKGTWAACRAAVPHMKRASFGRIVIVSSTAGQRGEANVSNYAASKGGQISFTKSLAAELAKFGINVNCVAPGWVDTEMTTNVFADKERRQSIINTIPLGRPATAQEIAGPIVFLCTKWANH